MELTKIITEKIQKNGAIKFDEFMNLALYHPQFGYYRANLHKFGKAGDFTTAPETSDLFGFCIAKKIMQLASVNILEFGAGSGILATQILFYLAKNNKLPDKYYILELSSILKEQQKQTIFKALPELKDRVIWLDKLPENFDGIMFANEVLDAMPTKRAIIKDGYFYELGVDFKDGKLDWKILGNKINQQKYTLENGYTTEFNLQNIAWIKSLAHIEGKWRLLLIDYGFKDSEFLHPDRGCGTLRCYKNHKADDNPFVDIGKKDITSWVNFSKIMQSADEHNLKTISYQTQSHFLIKLGIDEFLTKEKNQEQKIKLANEIKQLVFPNAMGESFKVLLLEKS